MSDQPSGTVQPESVSLSTTGAGLSGAAVSTPTTSVSTALGAQGSTSSSAVDSTPPLSISTAIQGNILAGFRKDHQVFVFLKLPDGTAQVRGWLNGLLPSIAATKEVASFNARFSAARRLNGGDDPENLQSNWVNVGFTANGLKRLGSVQVAADVDDTITKTFGSFVTGAAGKAVQMGDIASESDVTSGSDPSQWLVGAPNQPAVDAILTVAADDPDDLLVEMEKLRALAGKYGAVTVFEQRGNTLPGERAGHEHFGFKDGISQPGVKDFDDPKTISTGTDLVAPGEFVLGYARENGSGVQTCPAWMNDGSFQVWRRLTQDVPGFWSQLTSQLQSQNPQLAPTDPANEDQLAARLMGRWRSGTPVDAAPNADNRSARDPQDDNKFDFTGRDAGGDLVTTGTTPPVDIQGLRCPVDAHIRKMNPRNGEEASHRIMRRGIPFGLPFDPAAGRGQGVDSDRGLLFMAFMASIESQFEFLQSMWANDNFPAGGHDPIIGVPVLNPPTTTGTPLPPQPTHTIPREGFPPISLTLKRFVQTTGAVYAFAPSLDTLKKLANGTL